MNRDKHPICSRQGHLYHVLTPPLIQREHEYNAILGVTVRFLVVSFKSSQSRVRPLDSSSHQQPPLLDSL